jgi:hypothetical protein
MTLQFHITCIPVSMELFRLGSCWHWQWTLRWLMSTETLTKCSAGHTDLSTCLGVTTNSTWHKEVGLLADFDLFEGLKETLPGVDTKSPADCANFNQSAAFSPLFLSNGEGSVRVVADDGQIWWVENQFTRNLLVVKSNRAPTNWWTRGSTEEEELLILHPTVRIGMAPPSAVIRVHSNLLLELLLLDGIWIPID